MARGFAPDSVSIMDVAGAAGVSPSTVSRALHDDHRISQPTRERVLRLAQEMGYAPSLPARSLVTRRTATIGMIISYASDPFLGKVVEGVEDEARRNGYTVVLSSSYRDPEREQEVLRSLYERRVDGIVVSGSQLDIQYLELCKRYPLPIVLINCPYYPFSVTSDNAAGARQAVDYLLGLGHRRIAYVGNQQSCLSNQNRLAGYLASLQAHGIPSAPELLVEGNGELSGGRDAMDRLMALPRPPTAVFCFNDLTAIGAIHALDQAGRRVPLDCSVVGFDDLELASYCYPPLTTVRQARARLGERAIGMLLEMIRGREDLKPEILPADLVVRDTTGPAPVAGSEGR